MLNLTKYLDAVKMIEIQSLHYIFTHSSASCHSVYEGIKEVTAKTYVPQSLHMV